MQADKAQELAVRFGWTLVERLRTLTGAVARERYVHAGSGAQLTLNYDPDGDSITDMALSLVDPVEHLHNGRHTVRATGLGIDAVMSAGIGVPQ